LHSFFIPTTNNHNSIQIKFIALEKEKKLNEPLFQRTKLQMVLMSKFPPSYMGGGGRKIVVQAWPGVGQKAQTLSEK
jgi:hypothetical protein